MRILQVFRAPVGGLFRHVCDVVRGLCEQGHEVGIVCDSGTGGDSAERRLKDMSRWCELGVHRIEMARLPGIGDIVSGLRVANLCDELRPDILHGHGAKGGLYARLAAMRSGAKSVYTPHGGVLHYSWSSPQGAMFLGVERLALARTSGLIFVCQYERDVFLAAIGGRRIPQTIIHNGLWPEEFKPVEAAPTATDFLFIGELRRLKGVDVLLRALAGLKHRGVTASATIVGDGPDRAEFEALCDSLGLTGTVRFTGAMAAASAFPLGRVMVMPSRAESFPYIMLETIAAGVPLIASRVGGVGEVIPAQDLVEAENVAELAAMMHAALNDRETVAARAKALAEALRATGTAAQMSAEIGRFYGTLTSNGSVRLVTQSG